MGALAAPGSGFAQTTSPNGISPQAFQQIQAIANDKSQMTAAQKKLEPALLYASRVANGLPQVAGAGAQQLPQLYNNDLVDSAGNVLVDIATTDATGLAAQIPALGGSVVSSFPQYNAVRASVPATVLETLASNPSIKSIRTASVPVNNRIMPPQLPSFEKRSEFIRTQLSKALSSGADTVEQPLAGKGTTVSEAVVAHGANIVQNAGLIGTGVKVCVLSNGVSTVAARQAAGELPTVQILGTGQSGTSGDEGTAMLELVADMAPGASLGFSTGNGGKPQFAQNIIDLRNVMGCNIIVDDLSYYDEGAFQEDVVANAVTTVTASGAMYFSSSANSGHLSSGQSGTWEGDFVNGGAASGVIAASEPGNFHSFGGSVFDTLTASTSLITLKWSDPIATSTNDYDLFVTDSTGNTILGSGAAIQNGTQDPYEAASCTSTSCPTSGGSKVFPANARVYIVQFSGVTRALRLDTNRGRLSIGTNGSTYGHNGGINTITVGAVSNNFAPISGRKFVASDTITTYSSDGPRKLFINPTPSTTYITPGCFTYGCAGGGGTLLPKVDIAAADCDTTTTPGFTPFCGTSAAAPQAAAIAALIKSSPLGLSNAQTLSRMKASAIDIMAAGTDVDSGAGIVMADATNLISSLTVTSTPSGRTFTVAGANCPAGNYTTPVTLATIRAATCTLSTTTQAGAAGTQYVFASWSDNNSTSNPRSYLIPDAASTTLNMAFTTQYQLSVSVSPSGSGTVTPASGTFFNAGAVASLNATPANGFLFNNWIGSVASATSASTTITMSAAQSVTATFKTNPAFAKQSTTTTLATSTNPSELGQAVIVTVTVTGSGATGTVDIRDGTALVATVALSGNTATTSVIPPVTGNHPLTATYSGDAAFNSSTSSVVNLFTHQSCSDSFAGATAIASGNGTMFGSTATATGESGEPNHANNSLPLNSVWCKWTAPAAGSVTFDTTGSNYDTTLAVYTGGVISTLTPVASNDNIAGNNAQSRVTFTATAGTAYMVAVDGVGASTGNYVLNWQLTASGASTFASVLPSARSVTTGNPATAFATIINAGTAAATGCSVAAPSGFPAAFSYQTTAPNNLPNGTPNTPVTIAPSAAQSFVFAITPVQDLNAVDVGLIFACSNAPVTATVNGLNTLLLSASSVPSPDLISVGATPTNDGILNIPGNTGSTAFAASTINIGAANTITASIDDNGKGLALTPTLCVSNPGTGACTNPPTPAASATFQLPNNGIATFSIFVTGTGAVPFDPGNNRIFLRFKTPDGITRGATSVAVRTQ